MARAATAKSGQPMPQAVWPKRSKSFTAITTRTGPSELKALNRIKQVRHPFLLSLERIEIADGKLIVVTELADMSLKDRFDQCLADGEPGIPRNELLRYVSDAAEALDYISDTHSLQHLDIKPENLLLVSGHIKVADFGLVKEIEEATASIMGGLTPMYAAPELFDGRPTPFSDQYSLAIVYQEMLTAVRPFSGTTTAQLAAQHMQSRPKLSPLPRPDQGPVGRALAKDPSQRFPSCLALVEGLTKPLVAPKAADTPVVRSPRSADTDVLNPADRHLRVTDRMPVGDKDTDTASTMRGLAFLPAAATAIRDLPPFSWNREEARVHPTLFLGIGHTASQTLAKLKRRLRDRFGELDKIPAIALLCVDTDRRALAELTRVQGGAAISAHETLEMPLRSSEEYRFGSTNHLSWLSRRWLYNIPRNLQTEGIRPLGRLALVDHAPQLLDRLRATIGDMTAAPSLAATSESTGLPPAPSQVRVFILASASGGASSGMVLDVAYAVRQTLTQLELSDDYVCGILLHAAPRVGSQRDLAIANTCACLSELYHYSTANGYPGDESCGIARFQDNRSTFSDTYLLHLGEDLDAADLDAVTDSIAEYLYLNSVTKCGIAFDTCRELTAQDPAGPSQDELTLRTFGLSQIGFSSGQVADRIVGLLCQKVARRWLGDDLTAEDGAGDSPGCERTPLDLDAMVTEQADRLGLTIERMVEQVLAVVRQTCGGDVEAHLLKVIADAPPVDGDPGAKPMVSRAIEHLEVYLGPRLESDFDPEIARFRVTCEKRLNVIGQRITNELDQAIMAVVDQPTARVKGAGHALKRFQALVAKLTEEAVQNLQQVHDRRNELRDELLDTQVHKRRKMSAPWRRERSGPATDSERERLVQYARLSAEEYVLEHLLTVVGRIEHRLSELGGQLAEMRHMLGRLVEQLGESSSTDEECYVLADEADLEEQNRYLISLVTNALLKRAAQMARQVDEHFQQGYFAEAGGLHEILTVAAKQRRELPGVLQAEARGVVLSMLDKTDLVQIILESEFNAEQTQSILRNRLERAVPASSSAAGPGLLLAVPELPSSERLARIIADKLNEQPTVIHRPEGSLVLCYEAEQIPLNNVVAALLENRPERAKYAARLHTRVDIHWPSLANNT